LSHRIGRGSAVRYRNLVDELLDALVWVHLWLWLWLYIGCPVSEALHGRPPAVLHCDLVNHLLHLRVFVTAANARCPVSKTLRPFKLLHQSLRARILFADS
jgi:hypothetical protein